MEVERRWHSDFEEGVGITAACAICCCSVQRVHAREGMQALFNTCTTTAHTAHTHVGDGPFGSLRDGDQV